MPETLPLSELIETLRQRGFLVGVDTHLAAERLSERLGPSAERESLRLHLRALLAHSKDQQREFDEVFRMLMVPEAPRSEEESPGTRVDPPPNRPQWKWYALSAAAVGLLLACAAWVAMILRPPEPLPMPKLPAPAVDPVQTPDKVLEQFRFIPRPTASPVTPPQQPPAWVRFYEAYKWPLWLAALTIPALLRLAWIRYRKRTEQLVAGSWKSRGKPYRWPVELPEKQPVWAAAGVRRTAVRMNIRERSGHLVLDVPATVAATARSAWLPELRHRESRRAPEYLVLIERRSPRDHLAALFESLARKLRESGVAVEIWFFRDEPLVCHSQRGNETAGLDALLARYPRHRLLLFADPVAVLDRYTSDLKPCAQLLLRWENRAVLTAAPPGPAETRTLDRDFQHAPATLEGMMAAVDRFELSLPQSRAARRWHTDRGKFESVEQLRSYLGDAFPWLCACALYPELHYDLTMRLGARAEVNPGGLKEKNLLRMLSLPWFREGSIPDDVRTELYASLGEHRAAREEIAAVLERMKPPAGSIAEQRRGLQIEIQRDWPDLDGKLWQRAPREEIVRDPVTVLALRKAAGHGWFRLPEWLRDRLFEEGVPLLGWRQALGTAAAVMAAALLIPALLLWEFRVRDWNSAQRRPELPPLAMAKAPEPAVANAAVDAGLGRYRLGMTPDEVSRLLPRPFANLQWEALPWAPEYFGTDVRYFFVPLVEFSQAASDLAALASWKECWGGGSYLTFLFEKNRLFRISARLFADCQRREELLRDAARALGVTEMTGTPPVVFASRGIAATLAGYSSGVMTSVEIYRNDSVQPAMSWVGGGLLTSVNKVDGLTYVWIPPGKFRMGCSEGDSECYDDEYPAHEVEITRGFWLGETEVTQAAWRRVMATAPSDFKGEDRPVEQVSWNGAAEYCRKVGGWLPTEAEWEYAARAGTAGARYGELDAIAWYRKNSSDQTHPVRTKQANAFGLYDMLGNVYEWTADWYGPYQAGPQRDPKGPEAGKFRVARGGSWGDDPQYVRASSRIYDEVSNRLSGVIGFRCAGEFR